MSNVAQALAWGAILLAEHGCEEAWLDAELLLGHVLGWERSRLLAHGERILSGEEEETFRRLLLRRAAHEPLAYILGRWEFFGLDLCVDRRVLIPRPETELLVELALRYARERMAAPASPFVFADVGTGSGAIAIALARSLPGAIVYALDRSGEALQVAAGNCARHQVADRVMLRQGDLLAPLGRPVDCIVANLPYVRSDERGQLPPEIACYEPWAALDGGPDGLVYIRRLLAQAGRYLATEGAIFLEIGAAQGSEAMAAAQCAFPKANVHLYRDYGGHDRVVAVQRGAK